MKLFISWSGERSKALAFALRDWFPLVLHYVEPWLSEADIEAGQRWADAVAKELEACNFGIICITKENLNSPWVLFESGALAKSLQGSRVIPLLLDLDFREIGGPLAQFQAKKIDKAGLLETIHSINQIAPQPIPEERYKQLFEALWPDLERKTNEIPAPTTLPKPARPQTEVLEELVGAVRTMESRFRDSASEQRPYRKRSKFHPMMVHELGHMLSERPGDPVNLLIAASTFRDDVPWLYELGMDAFRQATTKNSDSAKSAIKRFVRALELARHGPFGAEELGIDSKMHHMLLREMEFMFTHEAEVIDAAEHAARKKKPDEK